MTFLLSHHSRLLDSSVMILSSRFLAPITGFIDCSFPVPSTIELACTIRRRIVYLRDFSTPDALQLKVHFGRRGI